MRLTILREVIEVIEVIARMRSRVHRRRLTATAELDVGKVGATVHLIPFPAMSETGGHASIVTARSKGEGPPL
jgi:hypothetical protein